MTVGPGAPLPAATAPPADRALLATVQIGGEAWVVDLGDGVDLSRPVVPAGPRAGALEHHTLTDEAFGLPAASEAPFTAGGFIGDTRQGGSVNCFTLTLTPHGNGTHTESVWHIVDDPVPVAEVTPLGLIPAVVLTVEARALADVGEAYSGTSQPDDHVISAAALRAAMDRAAVPAPFTVAVVVRVPGARPRDGKWSGLNPAYLTEEAAQLFRAWGTEHLLLEVPSADREDDGGKTVAHHLFWGLPPGHERPRRAPRFTITEMVNVPDAVPDGPCLLALHVPPIVTDAVPSRPVLFTLYPAGPPLLDLDDPSSRDDDA